MSPAAPTLAGRRTVSAPSLQPDLDAGRLDGERDPLASTWVPAADWAALAGDWRRLAAASEPNVFLTPAFALAARGVDPGPGLGAFAFHRGERLVGFVAGRSGLGGRVFRLWSHAYAPLSQPLIAAGEERAVIEALMAALAGRRCAALEASHLPDGAFAAVLADVATETGRTCERIAAHRRAALTAPPPGPSKEMRRLARRLAEQGSVCDLSTACGHPHGAAISGFLALEAAGWKGREGTAMAEAEAARGFFCEALSALLAENAARIDLLALDGRPVAGTVTLLAGDRAWYWKTAYDEGLARFSPGVLLSQRLGAALMADGRTALVDSCAVPGHSMIDRLWPGRLGIGHCLIAVRPLAAGPVFHAAVAFRRATIAGRALAKRLLRR